MTIDEALGLADADQYSSDPVVAALAAEVERFRSLFNSFQLECCDDWTCAADHARKGAIALHDARVEVERLGVELAACERVYETHTNQLRGELAAATLGYTTMVEKLAERNRENTELHDRIADLTHDDPII